MNTLVWHVCSLILAALAAGLMLLRGRATARSVVLAGGTGVAVVAAMLAISSTGVFTETASGATTPTIQSDLPDYNPGQTVTLTGIGWEVGASPVHIVVRDAHGTVWTHMADVMPDEHGRVTDVFKLPPVYVPDYDVVATQNTELGVLRAVSSFTDANPSANLDQCANGTVPADTVNGCSTVVADWVNGNLGSSKALYYEGDSIPYRMQFDNLSLAPATHSVTIEWDTTKGGKHAIDYLTSFNRTVLNADPCLGVTACPSAHHDFLIPADPQVTGATPSVTPIAGVFTMHGGTITGVSSYAGGAGFPAGDQSRSITITFTASQANPVLAWGGHISIRKDWGENSSAVGIPGSPYHMRLLDLDGAGGNQDRSLSAAAVIYPASITIIKDATPNGSTPFAFTASPAPLTGFSLVDDGTTANTKAFTGITNFATYAIAETVPVGWTQTGISCAVSGGTTTPGTSTPADPLSIVLQEGDNVTCTYANAAKPAPQLHLRKVVVNDNGGTATVADFTLTANGTGTNDLSGASPVDSGAGLLPDTWTLSETNLPGYTASAWSCVGGTQVGATIAVGYSESATCTITNDDVAPKLHLRKVVVNDNGGTATTADFTLTANGTGANDLSGTSPVDSGAGLKADTWALGETSLAGYAAGTWSCVGGTQDGASITVGVGGEATCTITNDDIAPKLHLRKLVVNDNGGTALASAFTLTANGTGTNDLTGVTPVDSGVGLKADTWALSESGPAGYAPSAWTCVGGTQDGANVTVGIGGEATCTITNDDIAPKLHLRKVVVNDNGGTATVANFTLTANGAGANDLSGTSPVDSGAGLKADTWALSETSLPGYTASGWNCVGGTQDGANITVGLAGEATCTITNNDAAPLLKLVKTVVNDNGGTATAADFTLSAAASTGSDARDFSSATLTPTFHTVFGSVVYDLSESGPAGYSAGAWSCDGGTQAGASIAVPLGTSVTCSITNNDIAPKLHLRKVVVNDNGGTATVADFTLTANGAGTNDISGTSPVDSGSGLKADTWTLSETSAAGYSASAWVCTGGTQDGSTITVGLAGEATCTITNNDVAPKLHLRKVVVNDNGGTATVADFPLSANGTGTNDLSGTSPVDSGAGLKADTWLLSETTVPGYAASAWDCVGGTQRGTSITVGIGGEATCTITNDDVAPILHLRKIVVNDNGGTKTVADFTLAANGAGTNDLSGTSPVDSGAGLRADTWALSETSVAGYSAGAWVCVGGTQDGSSISVGIGGEATCTITNNDVAPKLHLRKVVVNDNGGTATVADFTLSANGAGTNDLSGTSPVDSGSGLQADTWTLSETSAAGYAASAWVCVGGSQDGSSITVGIGGEATCTITNDDIAPILHLRKVVVNDNGGTATVADFPLSANGTGTNDLSGTSPVDSGAGLQADTWALGETSAAGYSASAWECVGGSQRGSSITVGIGGEATCTITNDDVAPKLHLRKVVVNDNGGTATVADFTLSANGAGTNDLSGTSPVDSGSGLQADTWALSETSAPGYSASAWDCVGGSQDGSSITVGIGGEATCTITNNDIAPILHLRKVVVNDNGGTATTASFPLAADGTGTNDLSGASPVDSGAGLQADTWALSETSIAGYTASAWICVGGTQDGSTISVGIGGEATCTITNDDVAPILRLRKVVVNDNGGTATVADFTLTAAGIAGNGLSGSSPVDSGATLKADTWTLSESGPAGYAAGAWTCVGGAQLGSTITVTVGGEATCTITNDDIPVIAPPVIAPPARIRGTAVIAAPEGCILGQTVTTKVTGRHVARVVFIRDGRVVKRVKGNGTAARQEFTLLTVLRPGEYGVHAVTARVFFVKGATPGLRVFTRRFALCREMPVTG